MATELKKNYTKILRNNLYSLEEIVAKIKEKYLNRIRKFNNEQFEGGLESIFN